MRIACLVIALLVIALTCTGVITAIVGGGHIGYNGYPDEWENKTCEDIYAVVSLTSLLLMAVLIVLSIILVLTS